MIVTDESTGEKLKDYELPFNAELLVKTGDRIAPGVQLNAGSLNPQDIVRVEGVKGVQDYILEQVQSVYRSQGVDINDKHVEIIVRQMLRKVRIEDAGNTELLPGQLVDMFTFEDQNEKTIMSGGVPSTAKRVLLGITKAALDRQFPFCGVLPRDVPRPYRSGDLYQTRSAHRSERERHYRKTDPRRNGHERLQGRIHSIDGCVSRRAGFRNCDRRRLIKQKKNTFLCSFFMRIV